MQQTTFKNECETKDLQINIIYEQKMNTMRGAMLKLLSGHHTRKTSFMVKKKS